MQKEVLKKHTNINTNYVCINHGLFDKFNKCTYVSDDLINSSILDQLINYYIQFKKSIQLIEPCSEYDNIMNNIIYFYNLEFASLKANYKSRLYLKLWLKKLILYIW